MKLLPRTRVDFLRSVRFAAAEKAMTVVVRTRGFRTYAHFYSGSFRCFSWLFNGAALSNPRG